VPEALAAADSTIFFIRPSFSKQASCATKFAESLACGVPVVINPGVGDHDRHLEGKRAGVVLEEFTRTAYDNAAGQLLTLLEDRSLQARCRALAESGFSLEGAVESYLELYGRLRQKGAA
jgi:glycosyltransferase involved in cell wall biosynthesis